MDTRWTIPGRERGHSSPCSDSVRCSVVIGFNPGHSLIRGSFVNPRHPQREQRRGEIRYCIFIQPVHPIQ